MAWISMFALVMGTAFTGHTELPLATANEMLIPLSRIQPRISSREQLRRCQTLVITGNDVSADD